MKFFLTPFLFWVFVVLFVGACASLAESPYENPPALENRTLRISAGLAGLEYQWRVCTKTGLFGRCKEWGKKTEFYDLTDPKTREKLINMGFVAKVKEKVLNVKTDENPEGSIPE